MEPLTPEQIPESLKRLRRWGLYLRGTGENRPYQKNWNSLSTARSEHWSYYEEILPKMKKFRHAGPVFVFSKKDLLCGVDLDGCRNADTGEVSSWAMRIVKKLDTYSEISKSGTGIKLILTGTNPNDTGISFKLHTNNTFGKHPAIEIYDTGRTFSLTGWSVGNDEVQCRQVEITSIVSKIVSIRRERWRRTRKTTPVNGYWKNSSQLTYLAAMRKIDETPGAISGQGGHNRTFHVACYLVLALGLDESQAVVFMEIYNRKCEPPWSEWEIVHKVRSAMKKRR